MFLIIVFYILIYLKKNAAGAKKLHKIAKPVAGRGYSKSQFFPQNSSCSTSHGSQMFQNVGWFSKGTKKELGLMGTRGKHRLYIKDGHSHYDVIYWFWTELDDTTKNRRKLKT